jgi:hypothetical protein
MNLSLNLGEAGKTVPEIAEAGLSPLDQLVSAPRLLEMLWDKESRPCLRWLRAQQRQHAIPFVRRGRRVWFVPRAVLAVLAGSAKANRRMVPRVGGEAAI